MAEGSERREGRRHGKPPFSSHQHNLISVVMAHLTKPPPPITEIDPSIPSAVQAVVFKALTKNPDERPTAAALAAELGALEG